ncbi:hypothetical protein GGP77_001072 [Salinibacter ruber]|jgi:hypothetical protein|nr:hypothetical protein [Salinibacter ruber]
MTTGFITSDEEAYDIVVTEAAGTPLAGTDLFWGFSLFIEFQIDGAVEVAPLPPSS